MKENNSTRRRLEALITVFELAEHHEVVVSGAAKALLDTIGQLMLHEVQEFKKWDNTTMSIELIRMERRITAAAGEPDPLGDIMEMIVGAMGKGAQVEVITGDRLSSIMYEIKKRTQPKQDGKSDGGATPQADTGLNPAAAWPFGAKE